jgi:hypothetical protein
VYVDHIALVDKVNKARMGTPGFCGIRSLRQAPVSCHYTAQQYRKKDPDYGPREATEKYGNTYQSYFTASVLRF